MFEGGRGTSEVGILECGATNLSVCASFNWFEARRGTFVMVNMMIQNEIIFRE